MAMIETMVSSNRYITKDAIAQGQMLPPCMPTTVPVNASAIAMILPAAKLAIFSAALALLVRGISISFSLVNRHGTMTIIA
jgi:hypothetical protein